MHPSDRQKLKQLATPAKVYLQEIRSREHLQQFVHQRVFRHDSIAEIHTVGREITYKYINEVVEITTFVFAHFYTPIVYIPGADEDNKFSELLHSDDYPLLKQYLPRDEKTNHFKHGIESIMGHKVIDLYQDENGLYRIKPPAKSERHLYVASDFELPALPPVLASFKI